MKIDIGISDAHRKNIAEGLKSLLSDTYMLYLKTHGYHWNVTGPMFDSLHKMFMDQYTELWNAIDPIAERIRSLGFYAPGTYAEMSKLTSVKEDTKVPKAQDMIKNTIIGHETVIRTAREIFDVAEKGKDQATMDLLTQRLDIHEKTAWMLRSLLE
ncbi:MAG TPA: Dps family protein [Leptospiraceae bacterium]|nr:Dps family protein [Leptospiraceae bacterium]HMW07433.1 Dps family protein [Leptospiraceae bacterium]HMX32196.1 Dps family protein [Leptospiraceae bacterium]HMY33012.1 Dps family protein [Leptospiraceae bacterium]HMZ63530.1 Dps family protein [Leptospiraceae bacterium]